MRLGIVHSPVPNEPETWTRERSLELRWDHLIYSGDQSSMTPLFLTRLLQLFCRHQFSWPHTGAQGQDYQVCLLCGATYGFDCATMCRTGRLSGTAGVRSPRL